MNKILAQLISLLQQAIASCNTFIDLSPAEKKKLVKKFLREHVIATVICAGVLVVISGCMIIPVQGRIIPMGPEMRKAFDLLGTTHTGKAIIRKAQRSTKGTPIFLTLGSTVKDGLTDYNGKTVVGVTRAYFKNISDRYLPNGVFVTSNRDIVTTRPDVIALNIAFELENVIYAMKYPGIEFGDDSPEAWNTLEKVAKELGLIK